MGRYPFLTFTYRYLEEARAYLDEGTIKERKRTLKHFNQVFMQLKANGKIGTTDPTKFTEQEVREFIVWMKKKGIDVNTQVNYLSFLNQLLVWCGNATIGRMRGKRLLPRKKEKEINSLSEQEVNHIIESTGKIGGWRGEIARFLCAMYPYTGLRLKELRLAQRSDLNDVKWTIWVRHPKGERRYGVQRTAPIPPPIRPIVRQYLKARKKQLIKYGFDECEQLIPKITPSGTDYYSDKTIWYLKHKISELAGTDFKIKDFRATFAQVHIDRGVQLQAVSKAMGHRTTQTTERYYARIRDVSMFKQINGVWQEPDDASAENPEIEKWKTLSGYV